VEVAEARGRSFNVALAYLRAFIIVLVVAHHAAMAYHPILPSFEATSLVEYMQSVQAISPVNDEQRSGMLALFAGFNDTFFMALLFLLSGLFAWGSLQKKGEGPYLRDRLLRLGVPLVLMVVLRPLTYYPTYLQNGGDGGFTDFWTQWSRLEWRGGPLWFLEVLLFFDVVLVSSGALGAGRAIVGPGPEIARRPLRFFLWLVGLSLLAYVPISASYGSFWWVQIGPAQVQLNRVPLYALYFLSGVLLGGMGLERTFLTPDSDLARRWGRWTVAALVAFVVSLAMALGGAGEGLSASLYVVACAALSFAFLATFLRFATTRRRLFDHAFESSYGIYVLHYGVVSWVAYALLGWAFRPSRSGSSCSARRSRFVGPRPGSSGGSVVSRACSERDAAATAMRVRPRGVPAREIRTLSRAASGSSRRRGRASRP